MVLKTISPGCGVWASLMLFSLFSVEPVPNVHVKFPTYEHIYFLDSGRDVTWAPKNKRPEKQKDTIKEAEVYCKLI